MKKCRTCNIEKELDDFYEIKYLTVKTKVVNITHEPRCKQCKSTDAKLRNSIKKKDRIPVIKIRMLSIIEDVVKKIKIELKDYPRACVYRKYKEHLNFSYATFNLYVKRGLFEDVD